MKEAATLERPTFHFDVVSWKKERLELVLRYGGEDYRWVWYNGRTQCSSGDLNHLTGIQRKAMEDQAQGMLEKEFQRQHQPVPDDQRVAS